MILEKIAEALLAYAIPTASAMIASYKVLKGENGYIDRLAEEYKKSPIAGQH